MLKNRYQLEESLGQGGMGEVFAARDRLSGQRIAIKRVAISGEAQTSEPTTLKPDTRREHGAVSGAPTFTQKDGLARYRMALAQEFRTLASLRHPNIIGVLDYGFDEERQPFYTMELLPSPQNILEAGRGLPMPAKLRLLAQLVRALAYLHRHGIIHRDLKPANVLCVGGEVKVVDFGIAVQVSRVRELSGMAAGTVEYMAPELLLGRPPSIAADLYAVGVLGFELLTEQFPFTRRSRTHLLEQVLGTRADLTLPDHVAAMFSSSSSSGIAERAERADLLEGQRQNPAFEAQLAKLDDGVQTLLRKLLVREPEQRYSSAESLFEDLNRALSEPLPVETSETRESFLSASRLIGRDSVLAQFAEAVRAVTATPARGSGHLLGGEAGVGKSRFLDEVRALGLVNGLLAVRGQAVPSGGKPLQVLRGVLRHLCLYSELEPLEAGVLKIVVPELSSLLGRPVADPPVLDAQAAQSRLLTVAESLLRRQVQPTLILLEDLHWADPESLSLLRRVATWLAQSPLVIVGSYRNDERPILPAELIGLTPRILPRLSPADIAELSRAILGESGSDPRLVDLLDRETAGNPHFVVEAMRVLANEAGSLTTIGQKDLPQTVLAGGIQEVLRRRLKRVPTAARPMLQLAATIGRQLELRVLSELVHGGASVIEPLLRACAEVAVLEVSDDTWRFSHDRLRDRLLSDLSPADRQALHLRVGNAMESIYREDAAHTAALAHHFREAGEPGRSVHYCTLAGEQALLAGALTDAVTHLRAARELQAQLVTTPLEQARVLRMLASALWGLGRFSEALPIMEQALALLGHPPPRGGLRVSASLLELSGRQLLHRILPRSMGVRAPRSDEERQVLHELLQVILGSGEMYAWVGDQTQMLFSTLLSINIAEILDDGPALVMLYAVMGFMGEVLRWGGMREHYLALAEARLAQLADPKAEAELYRITAALHLMKGQWGTAQRLYERAMMLCRTFGNVPLYLFNLAQHATVHYWRGDYAAADSDAARLNDAARRDGFPQYQVWALGTLGAAALRRGKLPEARKFLDEGVAIAKKEQAVPSLIFVEGLRALTVLRQGDRQTARQLADETVADMGRTALTGHGAVEGYLSTLETYLELAESMPQRSESDSQLLALRQLLPGMHRYARMVPLGAARAALCQARLCALQGELPRALKLLRQSLLAAQSCDLPYDEALAHLWLARLAPSTGALKLLWPDARMHRVAAQQLFTRIGAVDLSREG